MANGSYLAAALDIRLASLVGDGSVEAMEVASGVAGVWMPNMRYASHPPPPTLTSSASSLAE